MERAAAPALSVDKSLIFDIGMHCGQDTQHYLQLGYRVVAVEAEPLLVDAARRRFAPEIAEGRLTVVHSVIAAEDGPVPFWVFPDKSEWNTADTEHARQSIAAGNRHLRIELTGRQFASILREFGTPLFVKIDIEGADLLCVEGLGALPGRPPYLSLELSRASRDVAFEILAKVYTLGYRQFKMVDQALVPSRAAQLPSGQRYRFEMGSSGAFGEAAPGRWSDAFAIARKIERMVRLERLLAPGGQLRPGAWALNGASRLWAQRRSPRQWRAALTTASWFDLHAALPSAGG